MGKVDQWPRRYPWVARVVGAALMFLGAYGDELYNTQTSFAGSWSWLVMILGGGLIGLSLKSEQ